MAGIPPEMIQNVINGYYNHLTYYQTVEEKQFKHFKKNTEIFHKMSHFNGVG